MGKKISVLILCFAIFISGCASLVGDKTHLMSVLSRPSPATVVITDEKGLVVFEGETPASVTLQKSDGSRFGGKSYKVTVSKAGHVTQTIPVEAKLNGWYWGGNFLFGWLGWIVVDPQSGAAYNLTIEQANVSNRRTDMHNNSGSYGNITIVLVEDALIDPRYKITEVEPVVDKPHSTVEYHRPISVNNEFRELFPGSLVRVTGPEYPGGDGFLGAFVSFKADTLILEARTKPATIAIPITSVTRLEVSRGRKSLRGKRALIGFLAGSSVGAAIGFASGDDSDAFIPFSAGDKAMILGWVGGLAGFGVGVFSGKGRTKEMWIEVPLKQLQMGEISENNRERGSLE